MVLVDHNNVVAEIEHLKDSIVRVIDHHRIFTNACLQSEPQDIEPRFATSVHGLVTN